MSSHAESVSGHKGDFSAGQNLRKSDIIFYIFFPILCVAVLYAFWLLTQFCDAQDMAARVARARPSLSVQLTSVEGLDPSPSPPVPPAFHLAVNAGGVPQGYHSCKGGGKSMLRVSYHGIIVAWGNVPWFCIDGGKQSVANVDATAGATVMREEVLGLIQSEQHIVGSTEFDVEGEVAGLGYLRCKAFMLQGNPKGGPCLVEYY